MSTLRALLLACLLPSAAVSQQKCQDCNASGAWQLVHCPCTMDLISECLAFDGVPARGQSVTFRTFLGAGDRPWYILVIGTAFSATNPIRLPAQAFWCTELAVLPPL